MSAQRVLLGAAPELCRFVLPNGKLCLCEPNHHGVHFDGATHWTENSEWSRRRDAERVEFDAKAKGKR